ncbi:DUF1566 domain-containing protein [Vibrio vulnificus]|uniref:Lcl domain-containing protein n=1 Tax=Vibrio vulnificus TaxID=672 RepID=UPI001022E297|nr:DUF1566 domain-containing protein [Vibrio vulnificus]EGR0753417.1 DUF1566 domain-containing protein [Vibrio vulnificus]ELM0341249.1 DUF1566 domain-containing protein [Vibrio vulnificus]RZP94888.1 DUF1566 domain-containing protein [Vibrio vulnificus]RZQ20044.1 DUF1566 domain-containing protein [Vibrio vulnificus]RZQ25251.1 DUF1566 domain-containing protein [Vibrio vulnificus]
MIKLSTVSLLVGTALLPTSASAQDDITVKNLDINNGLQDYTINRTIKDMSPAEIQAATRASFGCFMGCHRPAVEEVPETISPKLAGLPAQYIYNQWADMDGTRTSGLSVQMKEFVYLLPPKMMADVSILLSSREMKYSPDENVVGGESWKRGKKIFDKSCKACHGEQALSTNERFPSFKGQMPYYLFEQLKNYRDETRTNRDAPMMYPFAKMYNEEDYKDIIAYVTGQELKQIERTEFITGIGMPAPEGFVLPDSGQVQNFTEVHGEDSDYPGVSPRFTISESGLTTYDENTKLTWERDSSRIWMTAIEGKDYCENLELDGYTDWRYPLIKELHSIADFGEFRPAINTDAFLNMPRQSSGIWTFPVSNHPDHAWHIGFPDGHTMGQHTASTKLTRCVRADNGAAYHNLDLVDNGDGTVTENVTNRMWQQNIDFKRRNWEDSIKYCEALDYAGYDDWRLPDFKEMISLGDFNKVNPSIDEEFFPNTPSKYMFWTSSAKVGTEKENFRPLPARKEKQSKEMYNLLGEKGGSLRWAVGFAVGAGYGLNEETPYYARCIRNP